MEARKIGYRLLFLILTILIIPIIPIAVIFLGISTPEYVIYGTLNVDVSQGISSWAIYTSFLKKILLFDFGTSTASGQPVVKEVFQALTESAQLIFPALAFGYGTGTIFGIMLSRFPSIKKIWKKVSFVFFIPTIVFSYVSLYFFDSIGIDMLSWIRYVFAGLILSIYPIYVVSHSFEKTVKEIARSDFFSFYLSCGFNVEQIWKKFCYRFIIIDYLAFFENLLIFMFGFIFFVETPFGIHGIGYRFVFAVQRFDYPVIIGFCVISIILLSVVGLIAEYIKKTLDPRVSHV